MSRRPSVYAIVREPADGGVSPNAYVPEIMAEVRCHYPPRASLDEVLRALDAVHVAVVEKVLAEHRAAEAARQALGR